MSQSAKQKAEQRAAIERLREWIKPGDTVYTILRHVSRSGMSRSISLVGISSGDGERRVTVSDFDHAAARALGDRIGKHGGIVVGGCGMDMGFSLVYNLSTVLFAGGFGCIGEGCPSNDHANGDRDYTPHLSLPERTNDAGEVCNCHRDHWHKESGYALRQRWL